ncbi:MAG: hypothetical protein ACP5U0_08485 [Caldisphaera sp.]
MAIPIKFLSLYTTTFEAERIYVLLSLFFLSISVYFLSTQITERFVPRVIGVIFFIYNPFMLMILSVGDSLIIVAESFIIISLSFLLMSIKKKQNKMPDLPWLISILFLSFSILFYEALFMGIILYLITIIIYLGSETKVFTKFIVKLTIYIASSITLLFLIILPGIYPLFFMKEGTSYIHVPDLQSFIGFSVPPFDNLILKGYPPNLAWISVLSLGHTTYNVWSYIEIFFLLLVIFTAFATMKLRNIIIATLIIFFSFLGAGPSSILFALNLYLYTHIPGYASLNASYYWEWFIISPLYFILLISLLNDNLESASSKRGAVHKKLFNKHKETVTKYTTIFIIILLIVIIFTPIISQGYYNNIGINNSVGRSTPNFYIEIEQQLKYIAGNSKGGVAFFPPDINLIANNNNSSWIYNDYYSFPPLRIAGLQYYGVPSMPSTRFFYWINQLFYSNETKYIGSLFSLAGIKYFVILKNTSSYSYYGNFMPYADGKNASKLMEYQYGVRMIYNNKFYSIYLNENYTGTSSQYSNLSLVAGGYSELSMMPYAGINISKLGIVMSSDISSINYDYIMPHVSNIFIRSSSDLDGIVIRRVGNEINLINYSSSLTPFQGWTSTMNLWSAYYGDIVPYLVTNLTNATEYVPLNIKEPGNYSIFFQMYHYTDPSIFWPPEKIGKVELYTGSKQWYFNASSTSNGITNCFSWENISTYLVPGEKLAIKNLIGWDEIRGLYITPTKTFDQSMVDFYSFVKENNIKIIQFIGGGNIAPRESPENFIVTYPAEGDGNFPDGSFGWLSDLNGKIDRLNILTPISDGMMYIKIIHTGDAGLMNISYGKRHIEMGIEPQEYPAPQNGTTSYIGIPIKDSDGNIKMTLEYGTVYIDSITIVPGFIKINTTESIENVSFLNYFVPDNQNVSNIVSFSSATSNNLSIMAKFTYRGPQTNNYLPLISFFYNFSFPFNDSVNASLTITKGFYINSEGLLIGDSGGINNYFSSGCYGAQDRKSGGKLYMDILSEYTIENDSSFNVTIHLNFSFSKVNTIYDLQVYPELIKKLAINVTNEGYEIRNVGNITIVRLPYYNLMESDNNEIKRFADLYSIDQIIFPDINKSMNLTIEVSFVSIVKNLTYMDIVITISLIAVSLVINRKNSSNQ